MSGWKSVIASVAPTVATALGGPMAGLAIKSISNKILDKDDATTAEITAALQSPENLVKMKDLELDFKKQMKELDINLEKIGADDRNSARLLATNTGTTPQVVISTVFIGGFFGALWVLFSGQVELSDSMENLAFMLLGVLASGVTMILKFWFGGTPNDAENLKNSYNSIPRERIKQ